MDNSKITTLYLIRHEESGDSFSKRVLGFVEMVLDVRKGERIIFMTHFGVIETILKHYINKPDDRIKY